MADTLTLAGGFHKLQAVDFSFDWKNRYTFWSGMFGATFLMLAYFGADQSQVQRYISGASLRESRLGLMFNAVFKIPMQFFILLLGVLLFVFYQFAPAAGVFQSGGVEAACRAWRSRRSWRRLRNKFNAAHDAATEKPASLDRCSHHGDLHGGGHGPRRRVGRNSRLTSIRQQAGQLVDPEKKTNDSDYVFITFILDYLPHGLIGLLVAAFFAAALSAKAAELNALASTTTSMSIGTMIKPQASDAHYLAGLAIVSPSCGASSRSALPCWHRWPRI